MSGTEEPVRPDYFSAHSRDLNKHVITAKPHHPAGRVIVRNSFAISTGGSTRRSFVQTLSGSVLTAAVSFPVTDVAFGAEQPEIPRIKAVAFDAFGIFDPRPISARAEELFPGKGAELVKVWRDRQFEYSWLRTLTRRYVDFWQVTSEALTYAGKLLNLEMPSETRERLMAGFLELKPWPDAPTVLAELNRLKLRLCLLSNFTPHMLRTNIEQSGLEKAFEFLLSTDAAKAYKPDPHAYQLAANAFGLPNHEIGFVAFAGWDAAGARSFGFPTFWVNRLNLPLEQLGITADTESHTLTELPGFLNFGK